METPTTQATPQTTSQQTAPAPEVDATDEELGAPFQPGYGMDGEQQQGGGQQESAHGGGEPVQLAIPSFLPLAEQTPEREGFVAEFSQIAPQVGLDARTSQGLLDMVVDAATTLPYQGTDQYTTAEDTFDAMARLFGETEATDLTHRCQRYVTSLGPKVADYLDRTGLGNDVGVIVSLALAGTGWLKLSPAQAKESIDKLMKTENYAKGDKLTLIKLNTLSRIANATAPEAAYYEHKARNANAIKAASTETNRAAAAQMMADRDGPLMNAGHPGHAEAVAKWHKLLA